MLIARRWRVVPWPCSGPKPSFFGRPWPLARGPVPFLFVDNPYYQQRINALIEPFGHCSRGFQGLARTQASRQTPVRPAGAAGCGSGVFSCPSSQGVEREPAAAACALPRAEKIPAGRGKAGWAFFAAALLLLRPGARPAATPCPHPKPKIPCMRLFARGGCKKTARARTTPKRPQDPR